MSGLDGYVVIEPAALFLGMPYGLSLPETAVIQAGIEEIGLGLGRRLQGIGHRQPAEAGRAFFRPECDGEGADRQRLHDEGTLVQVGEELEHALVDGTADREAESRVEAIAHVGEVLMGQELQQDAGDAGGPALAVGAVPDPAPAPGRIILAADVPHDLALDQVRIMAGDSAVLAVRQFVLAFAEAGVDGQGADGTVVGRGSGVGMEGE